MCTRCGAALHLRESSVIISERCIWLLSTCAALLVLLLQLWRWWRNFLA